MSKFNEMYSSAPPEQVASWIQQKVLWDLKSRSDQRLSVYFLNEGPVSKNIVLLEVQAAWRFGDKDCFQDGRGDKGADIRVEFQGTYVLCNLSTLKISKIKFRQGCQKLRSILHYHILTLGNRDQSTKCVKL